MITTNGNGRWPLGDGYQQLRDIGEFGLDIAKLATEGSMDPERSLQVSMRAIRNRLAGLETIAVGGTANTYPVVSDLEAETLPPPEWGLHGIYTHGGLTVLFGPRGLGKTFLALGWSFSHATGMAWHGRDVKPGRVVYIMGEGRGGLPTRVRAQKDHLGIHGEAGVYFITTAVPMLNMAEVDRLISTIETLGTPPVTIVWDTLSRTFCGGDENSSKDMAMYVAAIDRVKETFGSTAIVQHHTGHGSAERERGSSVLGGAADTIVALRNQDGTIEMTCEKQKDSREFEPLLLNLRPVGQSCVILLHDPAWSNHGYLTSVERVALQTLHASALSDGLSTTAWLNASGMADSSFYKARKELSGRRLIDVVKLGKRERYVVSETGVQLLKLHGSTVTP
jgi:hypothetical protein